MKYERGRLTQQRYFALFLRNCSIKIVYISINNLQQTKHYDTLDNILYNQKSICNLLQVHQRRYSMEILKLNDCEVC